LEWYGLPFNGPDVLSSGVSMDKIYQNYLIERTVGLDKKTATLQKDEFLKGDIAQIFERVKQEVGLPFVVKAPHQGSSIGVAFVKKDELAIFETAVKQCLFITEITANYWANANKQSQIDLLQKMVNLDEGIGFPVEFQGQIVSHPQVLSAQLDQYFTQNTSPAVITSIHTEDAVLFEAFVDGQEFSCGVIQDAQGRAVALPPTEIVKLEEDGVFDFKTKYKKSTTRKNIPIDTKLANNQHVQAMVRDCFVALKFGTCTRIDGFLTPDDRVILHDPNTIPGMSPASLIFKQMAEIGFSVTDSLTYFIRQSIRERIRTGKFAVQYNQLLDQLDTRIAARLASLANAQKIAVVFADTEQNYADAKKRFAQLSASGQHKPQGVFSINKQYYILPTNLMFKESVADLQDLVLADIHPLIIETRQNATSITKHFMGTLMPDVVCVSDLNALTFEAIEII
jgi:D-alanine-D-alanine ligase